MIIANCIGGRGSTASRTLPISISPRCTSTRRGRAAAVRDAGSEAEAGSISQRDGGEGVLGYLSGLEEAQCGAEVSRGVRRPGTAGGRHSEVARGVAEWRFGRRLDGEGNTTELRQKHHHDIDFLRLATMRLRARGRH